MADFTSTILRFRDLSTPPGTTVAEHARIIDKQKYVWWGWWHKQGETVAETAFRDILGEIKRSGSFHIFLFDSGQYKLSRAQLKEIKWDNQLKLMPTPDRRKTPKYYGDSHYLAWFRLGFIDNAFTAESELRAWSYVRIDEFFDTKKSIFEDFYNKQVSSFKDLRNQDRTIWFIRPRREGDKVHEIHVYDRSRISPSNFPKEITRTHSDTLLWISDPHFSDDHHSFPKTRDLKR